MVKKNNFIGLRMVSAIHCVFIIKQRFVLICFKFLNSSNGVDYKNSTLLW